MRTVLHYSFLLSLFLLVACAPATPVQTSEIQLIAPLPNEIVTSPLELRGSADKSWFTDGSLPVALIDYNGTVVAEGRGTMTEGTKDSDKPEFTASLDFGTGVQDAEIVIRKDEPLGDETNIQEFRMRVQFFEAPAPEVQVESPAADTVVESPLAVMGRARGFWFFEGSLPIQLIDADGNVVAEGIAEAKDEWRTEELVDFEATLEYSTDAKNGDLIIRKDNPSGEQENDADFRVPVRFR